MTASGWSESFAASRLNGSKFKQRSLTANSVVSVGGLIVLRTSAIIHPFGFNLAEVHGRTTSPSKSASLPNSLARRSGSVAPSLTRRSAHRIGERMLDIEVSLGIGFVVGSHQLLIPRTNRWS